MTERVETEARPWAPFSVEPEDYPIFEKQCETVKVGDSLREQRLGIDETLGSYVACTADMIAVIGGDATPEFRLGDETREENVREPVTIDHVVFLDKSARPLAWMKEVFWQDFSEHEQPKQSYLAIDRGRGLHGLE